MPDPRDHWNLAGGHRAGDGFLVERPEVFGRSAAAAEEDHVDAAQAFRMAVDRPQRCGDRGMSPGTLYGDVEHHQREPGEAAEDFQHVGEARRAAAGDQYDPARESRDGLLPFRREKTLTL